MMRRRADLPEVALAPWSALIPSDSFYARLAEYRDALVSDDDYAALYKDSRRGQPSIPPSLVVLAMLLQFHDDCSDREAEMRLRFDLRWKHALGLGLEDTGFDATVLCRFRRKLLDRGLERSLFERLVGAARDAGLLAKGAEQLVDSSHVLGAAGVRDTYTLIRGGIRKLLRALGHTPATRGGLGERLGRYLDPDAPEKPDLDWTNAPARAEYLREAVEDVRAALALVDTKGGASPAISEASALLTKIVADDVEEGFPAPPTKRGRPRKAPVERQADADGGGESAAPRIRRGVARDRTVSVVDPQMRVGHKSERHSWAGYKAHICEEPGSELITAVEVRPANEHDAEPVVGLVGRQEGAVGLRPGALLCDGAYGTADARADLGELGVEVVAKLRPLPDGKHYGKDEFGIDLESSSSRGRCRKSLRDVADGGAGSVTCPAGVTTTDYRMARDSKDRPVKLFRFPRGVCDACAERARCLGGPCGRLENPVRRPPGRQVQLHYREAALQTARAAQKTPEQRRELRERLRPRAKVERKIAEVMRLHGLRHGRYLGLAKTGLQAMLIAAAVNAKRLLHLAAADSEVAVALRRALTT